MKHTKRFLNASIVLATLIFASINISASENKQIQFQTILNTEKIRIMSLPAYTTAREKFARFLNDMEEYKNIMIKEMHDDQEYQKAFATIKEEIQNSGTKYRGTLSNADADELVRQLTLQFIPQ
jgi:hypothetical protein